MDKGKNKAKRTSSTSGTDSYAFISENMNASDEGDCGSNHYSSRTNASRNRSVQNLSSITPPFFQSSGISRPRSRHYDSTKPNDDLDSNFFSSNALTTSKKPVNNYNRQLDKFNKNDLIVSSLKSTFADVLVPFPSSDSEKKDLVSKIQELFDTQDNRVDFLEKELREKELQLKKLRANRVDHVVDNKKALPILLERYPLAMDGYRKKIEFDEYKKELIKCTQEFEAQKQAIINTHKQNYEMLKLNYRKEYKRELERIANQSEQMERDVELDSSFL